jgi:hypothetical protein
MGRQIKTSKEHDIQLGKIDNEKNKVDSLIVAVGHRSI